MKGGSPKVSLTDGFTVCAVLLLAACGGGKTGGGDGVFAGDGSGSDLTRSLDAFWPDLALEMRKDGSADSTDTVELSAHDTVDAADVCIPDCQDRECGDDGCGGSCGVCDDGDPCYGIETCLEGSCLPGLPVDCAYLELPDCWAAVCVPTSGECEAIPLADGTECNDDSGCSVEDRCFAGVCVGVEVNCDDGDPCTIDSCGEADGCISKPIVCPAAPCKSGQCDPIFSECTYSPMECDDDDPCTTDVCSLESGQCQFQPIACPPCSIPEPSDCGANGEEAQSCKCMMDPSCADDGDPCTEKLCHPIIFGCLVVGKDCDDGDPGTTDWCDPQTGACVHDCADCCGEPCTGWAIDPESGLCVFQPQSCNDWNDCTVDSCNPEDGQCMHQEKDCADSNACTVDTCEHGVGCVYQEVVCTPSPNLCLSVYCAPSKGCVTEDLSMYCDDDNPCTEDGCDSLTGFCLNKWTICDDGKPCTDDYCSVVAGKAKCSSIPDDTNACEDGNSETADMCSGGVCVVVP